MPGPLNPSSLCSQMISTAPSQLPAPHLWEEPNLGTAWTSQTVYMKLGLGQDYQARMSNAPPLGRDRGPQSPPALPAAVHEKNVFPTTQVLPCMLSLSPHPTPHVLSSVLSQDPALSPRHAQATIAGQMEKGGRSQGYLHLKQRNHRKATPKRAFDGGIPAVLAQPAESQRVSCCPCPRPQSAFYCVSK